MIIEIYNANNELMEMSYFQLIQWKGCISLEGKGLKHSRGSVTQHVRNFLGTKPRYDRSKLLNHLELTIEASIQNTSPPMLN